MEEDQGRSRATRLAPTRPRALLNASGLIYAGADVVTVQKALGHSSPNVTLSTYAHLWPNADDRTRKAAAAMFVEAVAWPARFRMSRIV